MSVRPSLQVIGTFEGVTSTVRKTLTDSLVKLLTPGRRLDILRDVVEAKRTSRPYTMAFCGVNGVGKSTNLAKVSTVIVYMFVCCHFMELHLTSVCEEIDSSRFFNEIDMTFFLCKLNNH